MLAGHPQLFAPPELELLSFNTLRERKAAFVGRNHFWLEGTIRALMESRGCNAEQAKTIMADLEDRGWTTQRFYRDLQEWLDGRLLVDKTVSYALDERVLRRAEQDFRDSRYIHQLRHPYGMIQSFEEVRLDQVFFRPGHSFSSRTLAELIWVVSHQNILAFLRDVPAERQYRVRFEDLLKQPRPVLEGVCRFLGLEFDQAMVQPYREQAKKMTDGIHPLSPMIGDVKFHQHSDIDPEIADRWRGHFRDDDLGEPTRQVAELLGYGAPSGPLAAGGSGPRARHPSALVAIQPGGSRRPFFCVHPVGGTVLCYAGLARHLGPDQPFYGLQARGLDGREAPLWDLETMAARYIEALRVVQTKGPYMLGGWSMGGVVAFEMSRQLEENGHEVGLLAVLDALAPTGDRGAADEDDDTLLAYFAQDLRRTLGPQALPPELLEQLGSQIRRASSPAQARGVQPSPTDLGDSQVHHLIQVFKANLKALRNYWPQPQRARVTLLQAGEPFGGSPADDRWGWGRLAPAVDVHVVPGDHYSMLLEPHVSALADRLRDCLREDTANPLVATQR